MKRKDANSKVVAIDTFIAPRRQVAFHPPIQPSRPQPLSLARALGDRVYVRQAVKQASAARLQRKAA